MAERKKTAHDEVVYFEHVADEQMATWPARSAVFRWVPPAEVPISSPHMRTESRNIERAVPLRSDVKELLERETPDTLRGAFAAFLEKAKWVCERCAGKVDHTTLKVPPPELVDGQPRFRMFCSEACATA